MTQRCCACSSRLRVARNLWWGRLLSKRESLLSGQLGPQNMEDVSRDLFAAIRSETGLRNLGNNRREFVSQFLVPALRKTRVVYQELREDVFGSE